MYVQYSKEKLGYLNHLYLNINEKACINFSSEKFVENSVWKLNEKYQNDRNVWT